MGVNRRYLSDKAPPARRESDWRGQEARLVKVQPGGKLQPGSGAPPGASNKGDAMGPFLLISGKTTEKASLSIKRDWLEEIAAQAGNVHRLPALGFGFDGPPRNDWIAFPIDHAQTMMEVVAALNVGDTDKATRLAELLKCQ